MIIETEPADMFMLRYKFYFNQQRPDPEDPWVLAYLDECGLEPRRQFAEEHDGVPYQVMHFGQCYLARHLSYLSSLYKRGLQHSVLAQHILEVLQSPEDAAVEAAVASLKATVLPDLAATLAQQVYEQAQFQETAEQQVQVDIDATVIRAAFVAWQATPAAQV
jgi:hypothetical protein